MNFGGFVLSAKKHFRGNVGIVEPRRFVQFQASLSLRKSLCIGHRAQAHNKAQQSLPLVAGTAKTLRLFGRPRAGRYADLGRVQK